LWIAEHRTCEEDCICFAGGDDVFSLFGFSDEADCGCGDVGFGADGGGEGEWQ
jgi:hypothetical protein